MTNDTSEMTARRPGDGPARRSAARVLIAEDERDVAELIRYTLAREGFEVIVAANGADALRQAQETRPDLMLLDLMLPQVNGWELCRRLKQDPATRSVPVIMLTARVRGRRQGPRLRAGRRRLRDEAVLHARAGGAGARRGTADAAARGGANGGTGSRSGTWWSTGSDSRSPWAGGAVALTPKEFELLATLAAEPGRVFGRDELLDLVWGRDGFVEPRTVDVHLARLRAQVRGRAPSRACDRDGPGRRVSLP